MNINNTTIITNCENCGEPIYDDNNHIFTDDDGNYFCCKKCALQFYNIRKSDYCQTEDEEEE